MLQTFFFLIKSQRVNLWTLARHIVFVSSAEFCLCNLKTTIAYMKEKKMLLLGSNKLIFTETDCGPV